MKRCFTVQSFVIYIIKAPYYDPKSLANIESTTNLYAINPNVVSMDSIIVLPQKCEYKKIDSEVTNETLKKLVNLFFNRNYCQLFPKRLGIC